MEDGCCSLRMLFLSPGPSYFEIYLSQMQALKKTKTNFELNDVPESSYPNAHFGNKENTGV